MAGSEVRNWVGSRPPPGSDIESERESAARILV
jgi:hypothetical protein